VTTPVTFKAAVVVAVELGEGGGEGFVEE